MSPTVVSFSLSLSYGILTARTAHEWFLSTLGEHEEFEVKTDGQLYGWSGSRGIEITESRDT